MIHFVLGGARSGKSRFAEQQALILAEVDKKQPVYIATATAIDDEMFKRINKHQTDRGDIWQLIECPLFLSEQLAQLSARKELSNRQAPSDHKEFLNQKEPSNTQRVSHKENQDVYLLDCLTLWLNNQLFSVEDKNKVEQEQHLNHAIEQLVDTLSQFNFDIIIVSNEVGLGVIPMGASSRLYVDYCGWLNQAIAKVADKVTLVTAGLPLTIKPQPISN